MSIKIYVGNLPYSVTDSSLESNFAEFGNVSSAKVMMDRDTGRSKGFGFVEMASVCNDDTAPMTMASLSTQWAYGSVYSPEMQWIGRGWFNLRSGECMNIDNLLKIGGRAVLYVTIGGKALSYPISASYDDSKAGYAGFSGFGNRDTPICVRHGGPFRYQRTLDTNLSRLSSCPAGMVLVHPSLLVRNAGSSAGSSNQGIGRPVKNPRPPVLISVGSFTRRQAPARAPVDSAGALGFADP